MPSWLLIPRLLLLIMLTSELCRERTIVVSASALATRWHISQGSLARAPKQVWSGWPLLWVRRGMGVATEMRRAGVMKGVRTKM